MRTSPPSPNFSNTLAKELTPKTEHERFLVTQMAESRWRLERTRRFESIAYEHLLEQPDETNPDHLIVLKLGDKTANIFDLLQRYATNAERSYYKAHKELLQGRPKEKRNEPNEIQAWLEQEISKPNPHSFQEMTKAVNSVLDELNRIPSRPAS